MAGLTVGGNTISIAAPGVKRMRYDGVDRGRRFDNSYSASLIGGAARDWMFQTPPVTRTTADTYETVLGVVTAQTCTGDVISIPTMCCAEITDWQPVVTAQGHSVVISFTLHEAQSNRVLLRYSPGDTITGESFSRSTTATYIDVNGVLQTAAINAKRDGHYINGIRSLLLEDARTNSLIQSKDCSAAAWGRANITVGGGIADPAGGTSAQTITATAPNGEIAQVLATGASIVRTNSVWLRRRTGVGNVDLYDPTDGAFTTLPLTSQWKRFSKTGIASTSRTFDLFIRTSGDAIDFFNGQLEDGSFASSDIFTTTVAVTRGADSYSLPFTTPPQEMSVYAKFVEGGTIGTSALRLFQISNAGTGTPALIGYSPSTYTTLHNNGVVGVLSSVPSPSAIGDTVEVDFRLFGDGSVDTTQSLNSGAAAASVQSAANALGTAWSGQLVWLNSGGTTGGTTGFTALQSFKIVAGMRSLDQMRVL